VLSQHQGRILREPVLAASPMHHSIIRACGIAPGFLGSSGTNDKPKSPA